MPHEFFAWVNGVRSLNGRGPLNWDDDLAADAKRNSAGGMSHNYMGRARVQCVGQGDLLTVRSTWMNHGPHRVLILDANITRFGLGHAGSVWTFNGA